MSGDDFRLMLCKLHEAMQVGVPFQATINFDGQKIRSVQITTSVIRDGEEVCALSVPARLTSSREKV